MEHNTAVNLISKGVPIGYPQRWADVGAGEGTFTLALASILESGSLIYALDQDRGALSKLPPEKNGVRIEQRLADIITDDLKFKESFDGILLSNVLHFIDDKAFVLRKLLKNMRPGSALIIIEYDTANSSQWIPYPLPWNTLQTLVTDLKLPSATKLLEVPSMYGAGKLYSALISLQ
jgi:2-polyprenyl-3-methyl-5-hydroxy-6-metoxy-1,4-benzoquinol methylase